VWEVMGPCGAGPLNAVTDVEGVLVGHYHRIGDGWMTGVTVVLTTAGAVAGVDVRGGGPGTRETDLLAPCNVVERVHAVCLAGGSAYGLDAAGGVMAWLAERNIGLSVGDAPEEVVPIVPAAVLFDLKAGAWGHRPDAAFGRAACDAAADGAVAEGCTGAGAGATAGPLKGGVGTASIVLDGGVTIGVLVALNCRGHAVDPLRGVPFGIGFGVAGEFDGWRAPDEDEAAAGVPRLAATAKMARLNTTLAVVATDADLAKAECQKVASVAHDGLARAVRPAHTQFDGDTVFALATGSKSLAAPDADSYAAASGRAALVNDIAAAGADTLTRAIVRAVLAATTIGERLAYRDVYPSAVR
jgi:L-aminopeptidase/D-esterase-like protein